MALFKRSRESPAPGNTTAVILAGGASSRFGSPKGLAPLQGRPMVAWVATAAGAVARETKLVLAPNEPHGPWRDAVGASSAEATLAIVRDDGAHGGPVAGLHAAAPHIVTPFTLVLAVDMPMLRPDLFLGLFERLSGHDAVAFHLGGWWRPLPSLWRTESLREALGLADAEGIGSLRGLIDLLDGRPLGKEFLELFSSDGHELRSINTPEQLARAEEQVRQQRRAAHRELRRDGSGAP